jgi:hypothetical protein
MTMPVVGCMVVPVPVPVPVPVLVRIAMSVFMPMMVLMPVVPQLGLVEQKEKHQTQQQGEEQLVGVHFALKGLWQQVQKGRGQQSACRQTEHVLGVTAQNTETQPGRHPNAAYACHQSACPNRQ